VCILCFDFTTCFIISIPLSPSSISHLNIVSISKLFSHKNFQTTTTKAAMASNIINWSEVQPHLKWQVLAKQKRFLAWALYSSIGSMMLGTSLNPQSKYSTSDAPRLRLRCRRDLYCIPRFPTKIRYSIPVSAIRLLGSSPYPVWLVRCLVCW
jgi:hypothetical protein